ncbi:MAG: TlpA family protein disulfide reductase [Clostridiales bacterium]|nr:TlpA family protein disulfide reductase [Clostridiales bacterium]
MNKILSILAKVLAAVVLVSALVYYNFIDKVEATEGVEVGDICPNFTVQTIVNDGETFSLSEETFTLYEHTGKVRIVNFWATWCGGCIAEMPDFNRFAVDYPEVEVITITCKPYETADVFTWLTTQKPEWTDYTLTFGYSEGEMLNRTLGAKKGSLPMTVILDKDGKIVFNKEISRDYEQLKELVLPLL